jgi:hypothetical protein
MRPAYGTLPASYLSKRQTVGQALREASPVDLQLRKSFARAQLRSLRCICHALSAQFARAFSLRVLIGGFPNLARPRRMMESKNLIADANTHHAARSATRPVSRTAVAPTMIVKRKARGVGFSKASG